MIFTGSAEATSGITSKYGSGYIPVVSLHMIQDKA